MALGNDNQQLISMIHDVATQPDNWVELLNVLPDTVNAKSSALIVSERSFSSGGLISHFGVFSDQLNAEKMAIYNRDYIKYEVAYGERVIASEAGTLVTDPAFDDRATIVNRPDVAYGIENFDVIDRFAIKLNDEVAWSDVLAFQYPSSRGGVTAEEFTRLKPLIPCLAQAVGQMRMFESIRSRYQAVFSVLNRLDIALLILDESSRVILKNDCAEQLVDESPYLSVTSQGVLRATDTQVQPIIKQAVKMAASTARGTALSAKQQLRLGDDLSNDNLLLEITPLSDANAEFETGFRGAMVLVIDPNRAIAVPIDTIKLLYGLTDAEAQVAAHISDGHSYDSLANIRNVQRETVKTQVASLYRKMKTSSRAGLVRRVLSVSLPFKDGD